MTEWALYLDESGDTSNHNIPLKDGTNPIFTLAGVALPIDRWREYDRAYLALKLQFYENEIEPSSKNAANWEFKGNRAIGPRNAESDRIKNFIYKTLDLIQDYGGKLFATSFLKNHENPTAPNSMYTVALQIIAEKFDIFLREAKAQGVIIMDSRMAHLTPGRGLDYSVAVSYLSYVFGHEQGRELKRLVEAPLFADSSLTAGLQLADIIAALIYANNYTQHLAPNGKDTENNYLDYRHVKRYWPQLNATEFESNNLYEGYKQYGFKLLNHRKKT